jgi:hypothetical protein
MPADIFDSFRKAAFGDIEFPYRGISIKGALRHHVHEYLHRPGAEIESLGRRPYIFGFDCEFHNVAMSWPDLYPSRLSQLVSLCESEQTFPLMVPNLGREIQVKAIAWDRTLLASVRSGESVRFEFIEDSSERYTADKLISFTQASAPTQFEAVVFEVERVPGVDFDTMDYLSALAEEVEKWLAVVDLATATPGFIHASVESLFTRCQDLARAPALQTAQAWPALAATLSLWGTIAKLRNESLDAARPLAGYTTARDRMSVIDVSMVLFDGDPSHTMELLQLNDFDDAMAIRVGTNVRYLAPLPSSLALAA